MYAFLALSLCLTPAFAVDPPAKTEAKAAPATPTLDDYLAEVANDSLFAEGKAGLHVVDLSTGQTVFARNADKAFIPASTMKAVTAAAAIRHMGPSYRFSTQIRSTGTIDASGTHKGNLYVKGHGEPTMVVEKLWKMVYDLKLAGVTKVEGDVVFDEGYLETSYLLPGWRKKQDFVNGPSYFPRLSALSINFNSAAIMVRPGAAVGQPAVVQLEMPAHRYLEIDNQVVTGAKGSRRKLEIDRRPLENNTMKFIVKGSFPAGAEAAKYYRSVEDPTAHFMGAFREMRKIHGIDISGRHRRGRTPQTTNVLAQSTSPPLAAVLMDMNKYSNNYMAELVLRTMGAEVNGAPGTTEKGVQAIEDYLTSIGVPEDSYELVNGSGLSRDARVPPRLLTAVLADMWNDNRGGKEFVSSLSIAGQDGTLRRRLTDEAGAMRGKTGTIDFVHCLAAYVEGADGRMYAFAFMGNDLRSISNFRQKMDTFARKMVDLDLESATADGQ